MHTHFAVHELRQALHDGQAQAGSAVFAAGRAVGLVEALEQVGLLFGADADASVAHLETQQHLVFGLNQRTHPQFDFAPVGELHGVVAVVDQHLVEPQRVAGEVIGHVACDVEDQFQPLAAGAFGHQVGETLEQVAEFEGGLLHLQLVGLDLGEVQDVVDQAQQVLARALDLFEVIALAGFGGVFERQVRQTDDRVQRRADFVAHVGQEVGLEAGALLCCRFGFAQLDLLLQQACIRFCQGRRALLHPLFQLVVEGVDFGLGPHPLGHVAHDGQVQVLAAVDLVRDGHLGWKSLAIAAQGLHHGIAPHGTRGAALGREVTHPLAMCAAECHRNQPVQWLSHRLRFGVAEHVRRRRVEDADAQIAIHGDDGVHGRIDDAGQVRAVALQRGLRRLDAGGHAVEGVGQLAHLGRPFFADQLRLVRCGELVRQQLQPVQWARDAPAQDRAHQ